MAPPPLRPGGYSTLHVGDIGPLGDEQDRAVRVCTFVNNIAAGRGGGGGGG
jgi:hypothetical protein